MAPKPSASKAKASGKGQPPTAREVPAPTTKLEFGYPAALTSALQAISARATQDLWHAPAVTVEDPSEEQLAQRHANAMHRLSKRIAGDLKAKDKLGTALSQWAMTIGQHLAQLVSRVRALNTKLDEDLAGACSELASQVTGESLSTTEKLQQARNRLGPIWSPGQEYEIFRIAGALRAFGSIADADVPLPAALVNGEDGVVRYAETPTASTTPFTARPTSLGQAPTSPTSTLTLDPGAIPLMSSALAEDGDAAMSSRTCRWKRAGKTTAGRPSKSPRRDVDTAPPWSSTPTGRTPEIVRKVPATVIDAEETQGVTPGEPSALPPWFTSWLSIMRFVIEHGRDPVGDLARSDVQDSILPLVPDSQKEARVLLACQDLWSAVQQVEKSRALADMQTLYPRLQEGLQSIRLCPNVLPHCPQGLLLALHVSFGAVLDPYSYAPSTAQEWLYPSVLLEHGGPFVGYIPPQASAEAAVQVLLTAPCRQSGRGQGSVTAQLNTSGATADPASASPRANVPPSWVSGHLWCRGICLGLLLSFCHAHALGILAEWCVTCCQVAILAGAVKALHVQWQLQRTSQPLPTRARHRVGGSGPEDVSTKVCFSSGSC